MGALLCERGGPPNLYVGRMGGPGNDDSSRFFRFHHHRQVFKEPSLFTDSACKVTDCYINTLHIYLPGLQQHPLVQPRVAMRHFVSAAKREHVDTSFFCLCINNRVRESGADGRIL